MHKKHHPYINYIHFLAMHEIILSLRDTYQCSPYALLLLQKNICTCFFWHNYAKIFHRLSTYKQ
jgi:hypothetical protein